MVTDLWSVQECLRAGRRDEQRHAIIRPFFFFKSDVLILDTIHYQDLRLFLGNLVLPQLTVFWTISVHKKEKLSLQFTTKLAADKDNPAYKDVFQPKNIFFFFFNFNSILSNLWIELLFKETNINLQIIAMDHYTSNNPFWFEPGEKIW